MNMKFYTQYDPDSGMGRHLYYHYLEENKPDKLMIKIRQEEAHDVSFQINVDHKYLILHGSRMLCVANVENLEEDITFKLVFEVQDASYVSNQMLLNQFEFWIQRLFTSYQEYVGNDGDYFLFLTNVGAPMHKLIGVDIKNKKPRDNIDVIVAVSRSSLVSIKDVSHMILFCLFWVIL